MTNVGGEKGVADQRPRRGGVINQKTEWRREGQVVAVQREKKSSSSQVELEVLGRC